jgi:hypothetical protein
VREFVITVAALVKIKNTKNIAVNGALIVPMKKGAKE